MGELKIPPRQEVGPYPVNKKTMYPNINTGVGQLMATGLVDQSFIETTGRFYIVGKSNLAGLQEVQGMFPTSYPDGTAVVYPTIKLALAGCLANRGDVILVMPGHTEAIGDATSLAINVAGVSIIGLGSGNLRPVITLGTGITANIPITGANTQLCNMIIDGTGFDTITSMVTVTAAGVKIRNNKFITANATNQAALGITTSALATDFTFDSNVVVGTTDAGTTNFLQIVGGDNMQITNNYFYGAYTTSLGPINQITTAGASMLIANNTLINATASSTKVIVLVAGSTGTIRDNRIGILSGTAPITGAGIYMHQNPYLASVGAAVAQTTYA